MDLGRWQGNLGGGKAHKGKRQKGMSRTPGEGMGRNGEGKERRGYIKPPQYFCQLGDSGICFGVRKIGLNLNPHACKCSNIETNRDSDQTDQGQGQHPWFWQNFVFRLSKNFCNNTIARSEILNSKCTRNCLSAGLCPDAMQEHCRSLIIWP